MDILNSNTVMLVAIYTCLLHGTLRGTQAISGGCSDLGMARGTIPNNDITASSVMNTDSYAQYARLGNKKAWSPYPNDKHPWIQVNLQKGMNITAIAVQGLKGSYITRFYLSYGDDGNNWMNYTVQGKTKVFQVDDASIVRVDLSPSVIAQYIGMHPTNCSNRCTLRMEIYGCNLTAGLPGRPSSLAATSVSTNSISIAWNAPAVVGDGITGYNVRWREDGASNPTEKVITGNRVATLDNLTLYTWYIIQVQAYTNKGEGPWSVPLRVRSGESGCSDLGMARGTIPGSDITASSVMNSNSYAYYARLGNRKAWTAAIFDKHPWIQVNLQKGMNITAIAVQGLKGSGYISRFYLSYGDDGNNWINYTVQGETKVYQVDHLHLLQLLSQPILSTSHGMHQLWSVMASQGTMCGGGRMEHLIQHRK